MINALRNCVVEQVAGVGDAICWTDSDVLQLGDVHVTLTLKTYNNLILGNRDCPRLTTNCLIGPYNQP